MMRPGRAAPDDLDRAAGQRRRVRGTSERAHAHAGRTAPVTAQTADNVPQAVLAALPLPEDLNPAIAVLYRSRRADQVSAQPLRAAPATARTVLAVPEVIVMRSLPEDVDHAIRLRHRLRPAAKVTHQDDLPALLPAAAGVPDQPQLAAPAAVEDVDGLAADRDRRRRRAEVAPHVDRAAPAAACPGLAPQPVIGPLVEDRGRLDGRAGLHGPARHGQPYVDVVLIHVDGGAAEGLRIISAELVEPVIDRPGFMPVHAIRDILGPIPQRIEDDVRHGVLMQ